MAEKFDRIMSEFYEKDKIGDWGSSRSILKKAYQINSSDYVVNSELLKNLIRMGDYDDAKAIFNSEEFQKCESAGENKERFMELRSQVSSIINYTDQFAKRILSYEEGVFKYEGESHQKVRRFPVNVYIKCYNRPAYVERCIRSIIYYLPEAEEIILLNDGIGKKYIEKLLLIDRRVSAINSPKVDCGQTAIPRRAAFQVSQEINAADPSRFWGESILRDQNKYVFVTEEDWWATCHIPLGEITSIMDKNKCVAADFTYRGVDPTPFAVQKDTIASKHVMEIEPNPILYKERYAAFNLTNSIYIKEYYSIAHRDNNRWNNEDYMLDRTFGLYKLLKSSGFPAKIIWARNGSFMHCTSSSNQYGDLYFFDYAMAEAWYNGRIDCQNNLPFDFDPEYLGRVISDFIPEHDVQRWKTFRRQFSNLYKIFTDSRDNA